MIKGVEGLGAGYRETTPVRTQLCSPCKVRAAPGMAVEQLELLWMRISPSIVCLRESGELELTQQRSCSLRREEEPQGRKRRSLGEKKELQGRRRNLRKEKEERFVEEEEPLAGGAEPWEPLGLWCN